MLCKIIKKLHLNKPAGTMLFPVLQSMPSAANISSDRAEALLQAHSADPMGSCFLPNAPAVSDAEYDLDIIVPVYGAEAYLRECLNSVLSQKTRFSFRLIAVNDGSPDRCREILEEYRSDNRILIIHQENMGISGARNTGIAAARGRYITFLDSDDRLADGAIDAMLSAAQTAQADLVVGCIAHFYEDGALHPEYSVDPSPSLETLPGYACAKLYRRELFQSLRFPRGYWFEDSIIFHILLPLLRRAQAKVAGVQDIVYHYRFNPKGISMSSRKRPKALDSFYITRRLQEERRYFSLENTQFDYEYLLDMVKLTFERTQYQPAEIQQALLVQWNAFFSVHYPGFRSQRCLYHYLADAIQSKNLRLYRMCCKLL